MNKRELIIHLMKQLKYSEVQEVLHIKKEDAQWLHDALHKFWDIIGIIEKGGD